MEKHYMKWPFGWDVLSERSYGFVIRASAVQYDITGEPCVLFVTCDGFNELLAEARAGRAYLYSLRVTVVGELEPGVVVIRGKELRNHDTVFVPEEVRPLGQDYAQRFARGEFEHEPVRMGTRS